MEDSMDILLIGGAGNVVDAIINKLNKEGHRIYILTGSKYSLGKYKMVYEKYYFEYDNESIKEILESINPDAAIFTGPFDTTFDWSQARKEYVKYSSGLNNILIAFSLLKNCKFIYLSSQEVYESCYPEDILEDEVVTPVTFRSMAFAQAESNCLNYINTMNLDLIILRLDHLIDIPRKKRYVNEICGYMCMEALKSGKISFNTRNTYSMLYISDAVEFLYKVIVAQTHNHVIYNISSSEAINEMEIATLIKDEMGPGVSIVDNSTGMEQRVVLSNKRFEEEFGIHIINDSKKIVQKIVSYMKRHTGTYIDKQDEGVGFFRRLIQKTKYVVRAMIPFAENILCFIPFFMLNNRAVGSQYFATLDFYLIYVLLFAILYGQQQATFSAILAIAGYGFRQMYSRSGFDVLIDYNTYVWMGHLFILGLVVGYMRDQLKSIKGENEQEIKHLEDQLYDIQDINSSNVRMKNILEMQVVNQNDSIGKIYEVIFHLEKYEKEEVLFEAAEVLAHLMNSSDVAIYSVVNDEYARIVSATSAKARELGNSIRYQEFGDMYESLENHRVFINKKLDERYPIMANAVYSEDKLQLILMVWGLPWERMTLGQSNMFVVIGYLIQNALVRATRYMEALENKRYLEGTNILEVDTFQGLVKASLSASNRGLTICTLLKLDIDEENYELAGNILSKNLRKTDYLGKLVDGKVYALLSNSSVNDAELVISRFNEAGYGSIIIEDIEL